MNRTVPTFLVAGAGRAGTTGLVEGLRRHPDVFVTTPKEPHYFALHGSRPAFCGPGDEESINATAVTREDDYLNLFPSQHTFRALGDGSVSSLYYWERALPEIVRLNPGMRVVVLLREPVARAYSSFQYLRAQGREPEQDFLVAVEKEARRQADGWHHLWHYTAMSRYAASLAAFRARLEPGHLGVWFHDDLEADYGGTIAEIMRFLDLRDVPAARDAIPRVNVSGTPRSRAVHEAIWRARAHPSVRSAVRAVTSWRFREAVKARLVQRGDVPERVRQELAPAFGDDLLQLRDLLASDRDRDRDLPAWLAAGHNVGAP